MGVLVNPSFFEAGQVVSHIDFNGDQWKQPVIEQVLTGLTSTPGVLSSTDKIVEAIGKIAASLDTAYSLTNTAVSITLTAFQRLCIVTATGQNIKLPASNAAGVIPGTVYKIIFPPNLLSAGTVSVATGDFFNGTINGTFGAPAGLGAPNPVRAISTGSGWWIC